MAEKETMSSRTCGHTHNIGPHSGWHKPEMHNMSTPPWWLLFPSLCSSSGRPDLATAVLFATTDSAPDLPPGLHPPGSCSSSWCCLIFALLQALLLASPSARLQPFEPPVSAPLQPYLQPLSSLWLCYSLQLLPYLWADIQQIYFRHTVYSLSLSCISSFTYSNPALACHASP